MSVAEPDKQWSRARASLMIDPDGIPMRPVPAPLARRFQQICVTMVAAALSGSGIVQLEWAMIVFIDDVPGIDQRRLSQAMSHM